MKTSIIESINALPPLSKTIIDINSVYASEDSSIHDLAGVIQNDPMIVANLLKTANSPLYSFGREIKNVAQAVGLFGMNMTRSIAIGNSIRKLLNVDMQPYGITPEKFADISNLQAKLMMDWYKQIDKEKADKLYLAAFLQETGKILIASGIIQEDETISFQSEVETSNNIAMVEKSYVDLSSAEVTAAVFEFWGFDDEFCDIIKYADAPKNAPSEIQEYSTALHIVKTLIPVNKPLSEMSINFGLKKADNEGYDINILKNTIDEVTQKLSKSDNE